METRVINVLQDRATEALKELRKIAKKAERFGKSPVTVKLGERSMEQRWRKDYDGVERKYNVPVIAIEVSTEPVKLGSYELISRLEIIGKEMFVRDVPGKETPEEFRAHSTECDHCKAKRARKDVFVVRHTETGAYMRVGRTCVQDFLGVNPAHIVARFAFEQAYRETTEERGPLNWSVSLRDVIAASLACISIWGWVPKSLHTDRPTAASVATLWVQTPDQYQKEEAARIREAMKSIAVESVDEVIAWVRTNKEQGDYMHNLRVCCAEDTLTHPSTWGIVCSAAAAFLRHAERLAKYKAEKAAEVPSQHIGKVGERLKGIEAEVVAIKGFEGAYGYTRLITFRTAEGNILKTWYSGGAEVQAKAKVRLTGTVKAHEVYNDRKETTLTRIVI